MKNIDLINTFKAVFFLVVAALSISLIKDPEWLAAIIGLSYGALHKVINYK